VAFPVSSSPGPVVIIQHRRGDADEYVLVGKFFQRSQKIQQNISAIKSEDSVLRAGSGANQIQRI
jgi:hypothetical protein